MNSIIPETGTILYPASFYLCGWKIMIDEARKRIVDLGYDRKAIHLELVRLGMRYGLWAISMGYEI